MKCPKCGEWEIHTWLKAVCLACGYKGDLIEFCESEQEKEWGNLHKLNTKKFYSELWKLRTSE